MKRLLYSSIAIACIALIVSSCASTKVVSDKDNSVDFTKIRTYEFVGWADNSDEVLTRFDRERIEAAFAEEGRIRGITKATGKPDVMVALFVVGEVKTQQTATTTTTGMNMGMGGMGMARGMRHPGWGWGGGMGMGMAQSHTVINESNYIEGTLMIEFFDPEKKMLIWQAIGTKRVNEDPKKREKGIPKKVKAIMKSYPVKPEK